MSRLKPLAGTIGGLWLDIKYNHEIKKDGTIVLERNDYDWKTYKEAQQFLDNWMPPEKWLTREEVKAEADKGKKEALMCSIIHWRQIVLDVEEAEIRDEYCGTYCGLCQYFNSNCSKCVLDKMTKKSCCKEWYNFYYDPTLENAIAMHNLLVNKYNELFGENDMKDEMLKIDGIDVSVSTIKNALKQAGIKLEKEYVPKVGEVFQTKYDEYRFILEIDGSYRSFDLGGKQRSVERESIAELCDCCDYGKMRKVGELKDLL